MVTGDLNQYGCGPGLASKKAKVMSKMKKEIKFKSRDGVGVVETSSSSTLDDLVDARRALTFKNYDLDGLPHEALPFVEGEYKGNHSYTVPVQGIVTRCLKKKMYHHVCFSVSKRTITLKLCC